MESNTKQTLLVTVVGVTLFVALLRFSDVLAVCAAECVFVYRLCISELRDMYSA